MIPPLPPLSSLIFSRVKDGQKKITIPSVANKTYKGVLKTRKTTNIEVEQTQIG